jgi:hypothetical protein
MHIMYMYTDVRTCTCTCSSTLAPLTSALGVHVLVVDHLHMYTYFLVPRVPLVTPFDVPNLASVTVHTLTVACIIMIS